MKQEKNTMLKNVLTAESIETKRSWGFNLKENIITCCDCLSPLFYLARHWGVVEEESFSGIKIVGYRLGNKYLALREVGLVVYCAECGVFNEDYSTWVYPDKKIIVTWRDEEIDYAEREEIEQALSVYNNTGQVKANYESSAVIHLRKEIKEYEEKNKIPSIMGKDNKKGRKKSK